jgi:hypothetical protein
MTGAGDSLVIREATAGDVSALAHLHVTTFNETHAPVLRNGPTYDTRERQWRAAFQAADGSWFCFVHRLGVGRRLLGHVARRFLSQGISSMLLFGEARNPSNGFYEALGAERLFSAAGEFHGEYGWRDLRRLASIFPLE